MLLASFEMQVLEGKCEALERCLPVAKATLQLASLANRTVNLASSFFPALAAVDASKSIAAVSQFLGCLTSPNSMEDFEAVQEAIAAERSKEKGGESASEAGSNLRLPYEEFVNYLQSNTDEQHQRLMQTGEFKHTKLIDESHPLSPPHHHGA